MNRRHFIRSSAALLAAGSLAHQPLYASVAAKANKGRIGIQLYSIKDEIAKDLKGSVKKLSDMGYSLVEPYGFTKDGFTKDDFFGVSMKDLSTMVKDMGMTISGAHIWTSITVNNTADKEWDFWKSCAGIMKSGGGKWAVLSSMPEVKTLDDLKRITSYFNRAGEVCKQGGVKFAFHNHTEVFKDIEGETILDFLIKNTDPKSVFFQLDLGHTVNGGGDCVHYIRDYPKRIPLWHVSDFDSTSRTYTDVGKGSVPYPALFELAKLSGLEQLIVEQETKGDIYASCQADFNYLKQFKWTKV